MYDNEEYSEMVLLYGQCNRNKREAARQYALKFPNKNHPSPSTIFKAVAQLRKTGSFRCLPKKKKFEDIKSGIPVEDVLGYTFAHPQSSVRDISEACGLSKSQVWNILHTYGAYPYRPTLGQELMAGDKERRFDFCNFFLNEQNESPSFLSDILWTDECQFTRQGVVNTHNSHYWSLQNPHIIRPNRHQVRWSVNVWCGIWKDTLLGPFIFDGALTSEKYANILQGPLSDFLDDFVPLQDLSRMWFQHDGAPAHKSLKPRTVLSTMFGNNILGYGGHVEWPPRSPDLSPLDFFLWGFLKGKVYETESTSQADLLNRISVACKCVTPIMLRKVQNELYSRMLFCIAAEGNHFEQVLR